MRVNKGMKANGGVQIGPIKVHRIYIYIHICVYIYVYVQYTSTCFAGPSTSIHSQHVSVLQSMGGLSRECRSDENSVVVAT